MAETDSYIWKSIFPQSPRHRPCNRSKHAACHYEGQIYLHGGRDGHQTLKDFWRYDIGSNTWTKMECGGDTPPPLQEHTMIAQRGCLFIFGGELGYGSCGETPLWIYSISCQTWEKPVIESEVKTPIGVRGHTAVVWHGGMHVYGGYVDLKGSSSELWTLDFDKMVASKRRCPSREFPPPRHCHSAVVYESSMWVYGGQNNLQPLRDLWKWSFESRVWTRVKSYGSPGSLYGHSAVRVANSMMIFGGEGKEDYKNELWKFNFDASSWHNATPNRKITPTPCTRHVMLSIPNYTHAIHLGIPSLGDFRPHSAPNRAYPDRNQGGGALTPVGHIAHLFVTRPHSSPPCVAGSSPEQRDGELAHRFRNRIHPSPTAPIGPKRELFKAQDDTNSLLETEDEEEKLVALATDDARIYSDLVTRENGRWATTSPTNAPNEYQVQQKDTSHLLINEEPSIHHRQDGRWVHQDELDDAQPHPLQRDGEWILEDFSEPNSPVVSRRPSENLTLTLTSDTSFDILCTSNPLELNNRLHIDSDSILCNNVSSLTMNYTSLPSNATSYSNSFHQRLNNNDLSVHAECNSHKDNDIYNCFSLINTKNDELPSILEPERKEAISEKVHPHVEGDIVSVKPIHGNLPENEDESSDKQELLTSQTNLLSSYVNVGYQSSHEDIYQGPSSDGVQDRQSGVTLYNQSRLVRDNAFDHSQSPILNERDGHLDSAHPPANQSEGRLYQRPNTLLDQKQRLKDQRSSKTNGRRDSKPRLHGRSQTLNSLSYRQNDHEMPRDTTSLLVKEEEEDSPVAEYEEELEIWRWPVFLYLMGGEETGSCSLHQNTSPMSVWKCCIAQGKLTDSEIQHILSQY